MEKEKQHWNSEKLNQGNDEEVNESKSPIPTDEVVVDTQKLDEVVNTISMDMLLEGTAPTQPIDSSKSLGKKVV